MKRNILFLALSLTLINSNTLLHGMEQDQKTTIKNQIYALVGDATKEWDQGNHKKHDELMQTALDLQRTFMNAKLPKGVHWIQPTNGHGLISAPSETKDTLGLFTIPSFGSLTTVLYIKYDNKDRYAAIATSPLLGCTATDNEKTIQQDSVQESCKHVLQEQNKAKKMIAAKFFLINHKTDTAEVPYRNLLYLNAKKEEYASKIKSIIENELNNIAQIESIDYYSQFNPEELRRIVLMLDSDKAYLRIGNIKFTDL